MDEPASASSPESASPPPSATEALRVHAEPFTYVTEQQVHRGLTRDPTGYLRWFRAGLAEVAAGRASLEMPAKRIFPDGPGEGDFRVMPCVVRSNGRVVKTVKIVGTNLTGQVVPDQVTVGKAFSLHPADNHVQAIYEACLLSSARTGACIATAVALLAVEPPRSVALLGCGRVNHYAALYLGAIAGPADLLLKDLDETRARALAGWIEQHVPNPPRVRIAAPDEPLTRCDAVLVSTWSRQPMLGPGDTDAPLVVGVGADTYEQRELDAAWADCADIYMDSPDARSVGDVRAWVDEAGTLDPQRPIDLLTLMRDGVPDGAARRVFISTGSALFDNLTIAYLEQAEVTPDASE